jgi:hypothetical protein
VTFVLAAQNRCNQEVITPDCEPNVIGTREYFGLDYCLANEGAGHRFDLRLCAPHPSSDERDSIMGKERKSYTRSDQPISRISHIIARSGLAIAGLLCGFYVAADVMRANLEGLNSIGSVVSMSLIGMIGFYLGSDIHRTHALHAAIPDRSARLNVDSVEFLSATGTFLAAVAALVSVYGIVFYDLRQSAAWTLAFGFWWLLGTMLQIGAGVIARRRKVDHGVG